MRSFSLFLLFAILFPAVAVHGFGDITIFEYRTTVANGLCPTDPICPPIYGPGRNLRPITNQVNSVSWASFNSGASTFSLISIGTYMITIHAYTDGVASYPHRIILYSVADSADVYAGPIAQNSGVATINTIVTNPDLTNTTYSIFHDISNGALGYMGAQSYYGDTACLNLPVNNQDISLSIVVRQLSISM